MFADTKAFSGFAVDDLAKRQREGQPVGNLYNDVAFGGFPSPVVVDRIVSRAGGDLVAVARGQADAVMGEGVPLRSGGVSRFAASGGAGRYAPSRGGVRCKCADSGGEGREGRGV